MIHNFKYVKAKTNHNNVVVMIFHKNVQHSKVKFWGQETMFNITDIGNYFISEGQTAGFIRYCDNRKKAIAYGESTSLNIQSDREVDTEIVNYIFDKYGIDFDGELVLFFIDGEKSTFEPNVTFEDLQND